MTHRLTLTRMSDIKAKPPPRCGECGEAKWYEGGTQRKADLAAGRADAGWRCPHHNTTKETE